MFYFNTTEIVAMFDPPDRWANFDQVAGPIMLLVCISLSVLSNILYGLNIRITACRWRLLYRPSSEVFGIWMLIYAWFYVNVFVQLWANVDDAFYVASLPANLLAGFAWLCCAVWTTIFKESQLRLATLTLVAAASSATAATVVEQSWRATGAAKPWQILSTGVPFETFAAWLICAASLSVGILSASRTRPDSVASCDDDDDEYEQSLLVDASKIGAIERNMPIFVCVATSTLAIALPSPVPTVVLLWLGVWLPSRYSPSVIAFGLVAFVIAVVRVSAF